MLQHADCRHNRLRTTVVLVALSGVVLVVGALLGGRVGLIVALACALVMSLIAYYGSARIALRAMQAYPVSEADRPEYAALVRELAMRMRMPMPMVYVSPTRCPNAFATGRNPRRAAICVTEGLLDTLNRRELRTVIAHELAHVANRDALLVSVAAALASMIMFVAQFAWLLPFGREDEDDANPIGALLLLVLGPVAAMVLQSGVSRSREYEADRVAAQVTGDPLGLADALAKLEAANDRLPLPPDPGLRSTAALMISNPFRSRGFIRLFWTHPSTRRRIARLRSLA